MLTQAIYLAVMVGGLNVLMNYLVKGAAEGSDSGIAGLYSLSFIAAFFVGCASITTMFFFYRVAGDSLARGLILMGAVSTVGGSILSVYVLHHEIDRIEQAILFVIATLLIFKWLKNVMNII